MNAKNPSETPTRRQFIVVEAEDLPSSSKIKCTGDADEFCSRPAMVRLFDQHNHHISLCQQHMRCIEETVYEWFQDQF